MSAELHVGAMPFPTVQGTQAIVHAMMNARQDAGRSPHLLTYGQGEGRPKTRYAWHRTVGTGKKGGFRSGPSAQKIALDLALVPKLARLHRRLRPGVVVAHHVEAALASLAARARPVVFFAHTALGPELPTYARPELEALLGHAGRRLDKLLCRRADGVAAISPALRDALEELSGREVSYVPAPWAVPMLTTRDERRSGREAFGLKDDDRVVLYAGNLDGYQGWEQILRAIRALRESHPRAHLVVATRSAEGALHDEARRAGIAASTHVVDLPADEAGRRRLHAAADAAIIPRRSPGGLPIKLLDALSRGVPTVATRRAAAGLPLTDAALVSADDDHDALAAALRVVFGAPRAAAELGAKGRAYVREHHDGQKFGAALDELSARAQG